MRHYYALEPPNRIGELAEKVFFLRNMYCSDDDELTLIIWPLERVPRINFAFFEMATRGLNVVTSNEDDVVMIGRRFDAGDKIDITMPAGHSFVPFGAVGLKRVFFERYQGWSHLRFRYSLSEEDKEKGLRLREVFGIPQDARIVTLHVREPGYLPGLTYHGHRDTNIDNFLPAIEYLIQEGFWVIRLGDRSMRPLKSLSQRLLDMPFHPEYCHFVDPYFISQSTFFLGTASGPCAISKGFGIPTLDTNWPINSTNWGTPRDLHVPKHYWSEKLGRRLTYEEILLSSLPELQRAEEFAREGIMVEENTHEEILAATKEMLGRLEDSYKSPEELRRIDSWTRALEEKAHRIRLLQKPKLRIPFFIPFLSPERLAASFVELNPGYLGHEETQYLWRAPGAMAPSHIRSSEFSNPR